MPRIIRVPPRKRGFDIIVYVGPWAVRLSDPRNSGRFSNGSRWHSPIHRWADEPEY